MAGKFCSGSSSTSNSQVKTKRGIPEKNGRGGKTSEFRWGGPMVVQHVLTNKTCDKTNATCDLTTSRLHGDKMSE